MPRGPADAAAAAPRTVRAYVDDWAAFRAWCRERGRCALRAEADGGGASLWRFLPDAECLAAAGLAGEEVRDPALLAHSVVASTFIAGLELARQARLALEQDEGFGDVRVCIAPQADPEGQRAEAALGDAPAS